MNRLYNVAVNIVKAFMPLCRMLSSHGRMRNVRLFADLQCGMVECIEREMKEDDRHLPMLWLHTSSLEEYAMARPVIRQIQNRKRHNVVLTFFSPTGYEALQGNHEGIDHLFLLPLDTKANAHRLIQAVRPSKAVFITSECWPNYLNTLYKEGVPTYLVTALIGRKSPLLRWWGGIFRHAYRAYTHIFVLDNMSKDRLNRLGFSRVTVSGNPFLENAITKTSYGKKLVECFTHGRRVFVASNINDSNDLHLVAGLANRHLDTRFIFIPHEITPEGLRHIKYELEGHALLYSECDDNTDFANVQVLVIDFLGALSYIYRYASWTYVGGGFTPLSHSVIETIANGAPVVFGSMMHCKVVSSQLISLDIGCKVSNLAELDAWFKMFKDNDARLEEIRHKAKKFLTDNQNVAQSIAERIIDSSLTFSSNCAISKLS